MRRLIPLFYAAVLLLASAHFYRSPLYNIDMLAYMGNALLREESNVVRLHQRVYGELAAQVPAEQRDKLTGANGQPDELGSMADRAANPYHFAEYLPFFAIRPLYNSSVYWVSKTGLGLVRAIRLLSALSYFGLGILLYVWLRRYASEKIACGSALALMLMPPMTLLGRFTGSDGLSTLVALLSLYLVLERRELALGLGLMLASIYFRTDNIVLVVPVLALCVWDRQMQLWKAAVLGLVAVASVLIISHSAGDYGIQMLYHRNFVSPAFAPGEVSVHFSARQYIAAFLLDLKTAASRFVTVFLLLGGIGYTLSPASRRLAGIGFSYAILHYVLLPDWLDRWFGVFYLAMGITAVAGWQAGRGARPPLNSSPTASPRRKSAPFTRLHVNMLA
jgi:hypothetical protein